MKFKRYDPPVGKCIYCGKTAAEAGMAKLTEEHIVPRSLAGNLFLPGASCRKCATKTGADEQVCARGIFWAARTHFAWRSRHTKRPTTLPVGNRTGSGIGWREVPVDQHPPCVILPRFFPPGILFGRPPDPGGIFCHGVDLYRAPDFFGRMDALGPNATTQVVFEPSAFCRMLAKIAHAYAVAELGLDGFEAFLPDVVLGKSPDFASFVGNLDHEDPETDELHTLSFGAMAPLIVVRVRLYARYHVPSYAVVAGRAKPR